MEKDEGVGSGALPSKKDIAQKLTKGRLQIASFDKINTITLNVLKER